MSTHVSTSKPSGMGFGEQLISLLAGSLLVVNAFEKKSFSFTKAAVGVFLLHRGITGHGPLHSLVAKADHALSPRNINIKSSVIVKKPRREVYAFWRKLSNLPLFMKHLESVKEIDHKHSYWKSNVPGGLGTVEWEAEIVQEDEDSSLGWKSVPGARIENAGKIKFNIAGENATEIDVLFSYRAPLGKAGETLAKWLTPAFEDMIQRDIDDFKRYIEAKETVPGS
ncbi:MAG TPA: SRPBCC family protein [Agriterribacter sp.]|nr:SRPBCC family protein [Agriterribacter sp.]